MCGSWTQPLTSSVPDKAMTRVRNRIAAPVAAAAILVTHRLIAPAVERLSIKYEFLSMKKRMRMKVAGCWQRDLGFRFDLAEFQESGPTPTPPLKGRGRSSAVATAGSGRGR